MAEPSRPARRLPRRQELTIDRTPREALARDLAALRQRAGLTTRALADRIGIDQARVSRLETGRAVARDDEVRAWARECGASDIEITELALRAGFAKTETTAWRNAEEGGITSQQERVALRERQYDHIARFTADVVIGLLQTREYMRDMFRVEHVRADQIDAGIQAREARQVVLSNPTKTFDFVMAEGALLWRPGSIETLAAQLDRIIYLMGLPNVRIGIIPYETQAPAVYSSSHAIYTNSPEGDLPMVEIEGRVAEQITSEPGEVAFYQRRHDLLKGAALYGDDARAFIEDIIEDLRRG